MKKYSVLIAEDESLIAKLYKDELERRGLEAHVAPNGKEAIHTLKNKKFDLVLVDLIMPIVDGYGVLDYLKQQNLDCPRIVITNLSVVSAKQYESLGANLALCKSEMDADDLWDALKDYLPAA